MGLEERLGRSDSTIEIARPDKFMRTLVHKLRKADGAEIAEAALVLPVVFVLLLGIIWFGRAFNIYSTIQQAAQQGAITAARSTCVTTCGDTPASDGSVVGAVSAVMQASSLDPTQIQAYSVTLFSCIDPFPVLTCPPTTSGITICRQALLNPPPSPNQPPQCGIIVSFRYPFNSPFAFLNLQGKLMTAQAQSRMEN